MGQISLFLGVAVCMHTVPTLPTPDLVSVKALDGYKLSLSFADGKRGVFDCSPYMQYEFMEGVRSPEKFAKVFADHGTAAWPGGEDLCPDDLYLNSM